MNLKNFIAAVAVGGFVMSCTQQPEQALLPSWNDTPVKQKLLDFLNVQVEQIPVEDRVAVFDMDGTIACERPLWFEMSVAVQRMAELAKENPSLLEMTEYQYATKLAANHNDTTVLNHWVVDGKDYLRSIKEMAFEGMENEEFIRYANEYLNTAKDEKYGLKFADMFYQPMLELIDMLEEKQFQVYIVSGSYQGVVWSVCPQNLGFDRNHLMGTRQAMKVSFPKEGPVSYVLEKGEFTPHNNYYGKSLNIYNQIGKIPVMAVGNTVGDFGMFHMASCSPYPNFSLMLNHDDEEREYAYPPFYSGNPNWQDSLRLNRWIQADMSKEFKVVWKKK